MKFLRNIDPNQLADLNGSELIKNKSFQPRKFKDGKEQHVKTGKNFKVRGWGK